MLNVLEGPELREDREEKKAQQHPGGFEPMLSLLQGVRSTTGLQSLPLKLHSLLFFQPTLGRDDPPASLPRGTFGKPDFLDYIEVPFFKLPISL